MCYNAVMIIQRDSYLQQLISAQGNGMAKVITGIRRCGKSFLLNNIFRNYLSSQGYYGDQVVYLSLEDEYNAKLLDPAELSKFLRERVAQGCKYILLDEIQKVSNFEGVVNGLITIPGVEVYITGSNSKFLSSDIITEFRGRGWEIHVWPLSFAEICKSVSGTPSAIWDQYVVYGGLPQVVLTDGSEQKEQYLRLQASNIYLNDIVDRYKLRNESVLRALTNVVASNIGCLTSPNKLANTFTSVTGEKINWHTLSNYLSYMEDAFMIEKAERYDVKGRHYIGSPVKYYFTDIGVRNSLINYRQIEETHIMENIVYNELRRRGYQVDVGVVETRLRDGEKLRRNNLEIDFVANKGSQRYYIQSALDMPSREKVEQEKRSLVQVNDQFKKIIITHTLTGGGRFRDDDGIVTLGIFDFLLDKRSLEY